MKTCPSCKKDDPALVSSHSDEMLSCGCYQEDPRTYWSLIVPYSGENATRWHPTEKSGPFSTLSRGCFKTKAAAREWARENLVTKKENGEVIGYPYSLKEYANAAYIAPAFNAEILKAAVSKYYSLAAAGPEANEVNIFLGDSYRQETAEWMHTNHPLWIAQFNMDLVEWVLVTYHGAKNES